jgi:small GTP-binding protein
MSNLEEQTKKVKPILSDADLESLGIHKKTVYKFKVCLIGEIAVGKTSIIERYITGNFNNEYNCTCGTEYRLKTVSREGYGAAEISIWDTAGGEKYRSITKNYFRDAQGIAIVFDLTNKNSFTSLDVWLKEVKDTVSESTEIVIVGNKSDLVDNRKIEEKDIELFMIENNLKYFESSAKNGTNIDQVFQYFTEVVLEKIKNKEIVMSKKKKLLKQSNTNNYKNNDECFC